MQNQFAKLLRDDTRYQREAYELVRNALTYAQERAAQIELLPSESEGGESVEPHLSGQQLCEAIRDFVSDQFGMMAKVVLNNWGVRTTGDFGEIVYNLIRIGEMRKSKSDRREDFDNVYDFDDVFQRNFEITV